MSEFKCIGLIGRLDSESTSYSLSRLITYLKKQEVEILLDEETAAVFEKPPLEVASRGALSLRCDLIIVVGVIGGYHIL